MPTDPVYNPQLPSASVHSDTSSRMRAQSSWSGNVSMSDARCSSLTALSAGLVAGACAGAALALLFTPARGSEMRDSIRRYASDGGERLSHLIENGRAMAEDAVHRAAALVDQGRNALRTRSLTSRSESSMASGTNYLRSGSQPLTASVAEISGIDSRFEEPLGG